MAMASRSTSSGILESLGRPTLIDGNYTRVPRGSSGSYQELSQYGLWPSKLPDYYSLFPQTEDKLKGLSYDSRGLDAYRNRALSTGQSPWASLQQQSNQMDSDRALSGIGGSTQGGDTGAVSNLAMRGGATAGARERLAGTAMQSANQARQQIYGQSAQRGLDIGIEDERQRLEALGRLPGLESQYTQTQIAQLNPWLTMAQLEQQGRNNYNLGKFQTQMEAYGAAQTADALARRGL